MPSLHSLPPERLQDIALLLVAHDPLGPPSALVPLLLVSRHVHAALSAPALLARIFRLKFDAGAVARRLFAPRAQDLAEQLVAACTLLRFLRRAPSVHDIDADHHLDAALLMMLDNDGKNYAQLAHAGIHPFLRAYAHTRVWERREENEGWPRDSQTNRAALWVMWLTTSRAHLLAEPPSEREALIDAVLPFAVLPQRYAASYAPPNHSTLPLPFTPSNSHQLPITFALPNSHRRYPHYLPARASDQPYFNARVELTTPPASIPAKLLFVARRELRAAVIPAHVPPGPGGPGMPLTQDDYHALNNAKAAVLPRGATWDWDLGVAVSVNPRGQTEARVIREGDEESRRWDATFWKMRLCGDVMERRPVFEPGQVYDLGSMSGLWQGKIYIPMGAQFNHVLQNPIYPSIPHPDPERAQLQAQGQQPRLFSESSLQLIMQPTFLDMQEHHRICMCAGRGSRDDACDAHEEEKEENTGIGGIGGGGCGIVPTPAPHPMLLRGDASLSLSLAGGQGVIVPHHPGAAGADEDEDVHLPADATGAGAPIAPENVPRNSYALPGNGAGAVNVNVDLGMCNAWFEGEQGGVSFVPRKGGNLGGNGKERRDEVVVATGFGRVDARARGRCSAGASASSSSSAASSSAGAGASGSGDGDVSSSSSSDEENSSPPSKSKSKSKSKSNGSNSYVYETYDPAKLSSHDVLAASSSSSSTHIQTKGEPQGCPTCVTCQLRDTARRAQKAREDEEARRILDRMMRGVGRGCPDVDKEGMVVDKEEEGEEMQDLDMHDFAAGFEDVVRSAFGSSHSHSSSHSASSHSVDSEDADSDASDSEMEFAEHVCVPGKTHYVGIRDEEDGDLYTFLPVRSGRGRGQERDRGRVEVLGDDKPRGERGYVCYTCVGGAGDEEEEGGMKGRDRKRKRRHGVSASASRHRAGKRVKEGAAMGTYASTSASTSSASSSDGTSSYADPQPHPHSSTSSSAHPKHQHPHPHPHARGGKDHTAHTIPATRREFDRSRIGTPCTGVRDILLSGARPSPSTSLYQDFTIYGRVRAWDGLVGMLRMSRAGGGGGGGGQGQGAKSFLFVFGYVVGAGTRVGGEGRKRIVGGSFVGEWRMAGSDPMRPSWGGPFVMSRLEEEEDS